MHMCVRVLIYKIPQNKSLSTLWKPPLRPHMLVKGKWKMIMLRYHLKYNSPRKQIAMKDPRMIPSLRFFAPILPIKLLIPGT